MENNAPTSNLAAFLSEVSQEYAQLVPSEWITACGGAQNLVTGSHTAGGPLKVQCKTTGTPLDVQVRDGFENDERLPQVIASKLYSMTPHGAQKAHVRELLSKVGQQYAQLVPPAQLADTMRGGGPGPVSGSYAPGGPLTVKCNITGTVLSVPLNEGFENDANLPSTIARKLRSMARGA